MDNVSTIVAFGAGIISFISPCVLPLIPAYISFISGVSVADLKGELSNKDRMKKVMVRSLVFVLGFSLVFVLLGATATFIGKFMLEKLSLLSKIAGVIIVIFGLHMTGIFKLKFLNYEKRFASGGTEVSLLGTFLIGLSFAFGWTPCIGPILAGILAIAATKETVWSGIWLLGVYSAGMGLPFLLTAYATSRFVTYFSKVKKHFHAVEIIAGSLLIVIGVLIFFDYFTVLSAWFAKFLPALG